MRRAGPLAPPFLVLGNPENRRVGLFQEALAGLCQPPAQVVSWESLLEDVGALARLPDAPLFVRLDSWGENAAVERGLLKLGYAAAREAGCTALSPEALDARPLARGEVLAPRQAHLGFLRLLGRLEEVFAARPRWRVLNPPASVAELFDKRLTSRRYAALGIPVPPPFEGVDSHESLRAELARRGCTTAFVKLSCGSSASCLAVYSLRDGEASALTTVEQTREGWFNSLKLRRVRGAPLDALLAFLFREGSQVEEAVPKATLGGRPFDTRVLVVAGEPAFTVVRQSRHVVTNLHLGGWRGSLEALRARVPEDVYGAAMESCRRVYAAHGCLHVGVDLMYEAGFGGHRVLEANAFGDLLPNLFREGLGTYGWQVHTLLEGRWR
jgi:hypothetical protein